MADIVLFKGGSLPANAANLRTSALRAKDAISVSGSTPFLRLEKGTGMWVYGTKSTEVEENSLWAVDPTTIEIGWVAWRGGKPIGKKMRSISQPNILASELPAVGADWQENVQFDLQCVHGEDTGQVVTYSSNSGGGREAFSELMSAFIRQTENDPGNIVPVIDLQTDWYMHAEYGKIHKPVFTIRKWVGFGGGQEQAPAEPPPASTSTATNGAAEPPVKEAAAPSRRRAAAAVTDVEDDTQPETPPPGAAAEPVQRRRRRAAAG